MVQVFILSSLIVPIECSVNVPIGSLVVVKFTYFATYTVRIS